MTLGQFYQVYRVSMRVRVDELFGELAEYRRLYNRIALKRPDDPTMIANRMLQSWREQNPITTASVGIAVRLVGELPQNTFERADEALYRAKHDGRDRVAMAPVSVSPHA